MFFFGLFMLFFDFASPNQPLPKVCVIWEDFHNIWAYNPKRDNSLYWINKHNCSNNYMVKYRRKIMKLVSVSDLILCFFNHKQYVL